MTLLGFNHVLSASDLPMTPLSVCSQWSGWLRDGVTANQITRIRDQPMDNCKQVDWITICINRLWGLKLPFRELFCRLLYRNEDEHGHRAFATVVLHTSGWSLHALGMEGFLQSAHDWTATPPCDQMYNPTFTPCPLLPHRAHTMCKYLDQCLRATGLSAAFCLISSAQHAWQCFSAYRTHRIQLPWPWTGKKHNPLIGNSSALQNIASSKWPIKVRKKSNFTNNCPHRQKCINIFPHSFLSDGCIIEQD